MRRVALCLLVAAAIAAISGCAAMWVETPTPVSPAQGVPSLTPSPTRTSTPTRPRPTLAPGQPTPTRPSTSVIVDGNTIQHWSDPNDIRRLVFDGQHLWAATSAGVVRWTLDGQHHLFGVGDGLLSVAIQGLAQDADGRIWVGYAGLDGWSVWDGESWLSYESRMAAIEANYSSLTYPQHADPRLWALGPDHDWIWIATLDGELRNYDGTRWRRYNAYSGITRGTWMVGLDGERRVWAIGSGVSTAVEGDVWWEDHDFISEVSERGQITDMEVDAEGALWLSFTGASGRDGGVCRYDMGTGRWSGYLPELNDLLPPQVHSVTIDDDSTIWLCGQDGLSWQKLRQPWHRIDLPGVTVRDLARDREGRLWLGTSQGLWSVSDSGTSLGGPWRVPSPLIGGSVLDLAYDATGNLWVATTEGVSRFTGDGRAEIVLIEPMLALTADAKGQIWAATRAGLKHLASDGNPDTLLEEQVIAMAAGPDGSMWLCTTSGEVMRGSSTFETVTTMETLFAEAHLQHDESVASDETEPTPLPTAPAQPVVERVSMPRAMAVTEESTLWLATDRGLLSLDAEGQTNLFTKRDRLLTNDVRGLAIDHQGQLWAATAKGLVRRRIDGRWTRFTSSSTEGGLRSMELWSATVASDDTVQVATDSGVSLRTPENADWSYIDLPNARLVLSDGEKGLWVGTTSGLYHVPLGSLTAVP